ncbi:hypothetical protein FWH09_03260, partial [Candidatus Saccharibacteria bacterium]|nr:hypothetical protein [Candidatus Saccharibacteria bacterium]
GQLHRYLNLHRIIWERIDEVKRQGKIRGRDIGALRDKVEGYSKTVNLIEARINQMNAYLRTRESIVKEDEELRYFMEVIGYRYEAMANTLSYMQDIWVMTKNYVDSSMALFSDLHSESTDSSIHSLTIVTSMGVGATLIGLFTTSSAPEFTVFGVFYFLALAAIGFSVAKIMKWIYGRRSYKISEVDYDKDIK